ncbi:hypothetical protein [Haloprofundus halophilus]|uniref:hypothetical protein n=1 Tax=Haloprofundus halophilus TaxID=2283527 RepID=UPI000E43FE27|nr:hypothetical protein [Haloprofundus halophilus]
MTRFHDPTYTTHERDYGQETAGLRRRTVLGALAAAGFLGSAEAAAAAENDAGTGDGDDSADSAAATQQEDVPVGTDALLAYVEANYGDQLSDDQLDAVRTRLAGILASGGAVGEFDLAYTTDPAYTFEPYRGEE